MKIPKTVKVGNKVRERYPTYRKGTIIAIRHNWRNSPVSFGEDGWGIYPLEHLLDHTGKPLANYPLVKDNRPTIPLENNNCTHCKLYRTECKDMSISSKW